VKIVVLLPGGTVDKGNVRDIDLGRGAEGKIGGSEYEVVRVPNVSRIVSIFMLEALHVSESSEINPDFVIATPSPPPRSHTHLLSSIA
jgi:hypothetical protein